MELKYIRAVLLCSVLAFALGTLIIYMFAGDLGNVAPIKPMEQLLPVTVTKIYLNHTADFQNYATGDLFTECMATEPIGTITIEQDPMYAGMKSLTKLGQSGYFKYYRWRDIKLTNSTVSFLETVRITGGDSGTPYMVWMGMSSDTQTYPYIELMVNSGRFKINVRQSTVTSPIASIDCGPKDTFPHKVYVSWSSSLITIRFGEVYQEIPVPSNWIISVNNGSRCYFYPNAYLRYHCMTLFGPEVAK